MNIENNLKNDLFNARKDFCFTISFVKKKKWAINTLEQSENKIKSKEIKQKM